MALLQISQEVLKVLTIYEKTHLLEVSIRGSWVKGIC